MNTLLVNIFGAPGSGKSTSATGAFSLLKLAKVNCELAFEFAKEISWEERHSALKCQPYVFGKQLHRIERLWGKVDVIVTDSPLLLSRFYGEKYADYPPSFYQFVTDQAERIGGVNYFIRRVKSYNPAGRNQTEDESKEIAGELESLLLRLGIQYTSIDGDAMAPQIIAEAIQARLARGED